MFYTYKITFEDGYYYYGLRKVKNSNPDEDAYFGSPVTFREKWEQTPFTKEVLEVFDCWEVAAKAEKDLIKPSYKSDPKCLNRNCGGSIHPDLCKEGGKKKDPVARERDSRKGGHQAAKKKKGVHSPEFQGSQKHRESGSKGGSIGGKVSGRNNVLNGHFDSIKHLGAAAQHAQKWMNTHPGHDPFVSTPCGLSHWQNKRNIPTHYRRKVSQ